jgi:hypothetical protein
MTERTISDFLRALPVQDVQRILRASASRTADFRAGKRMTGRRLSLALRDVVLPKLGGDETETARVLLASAKSWDSDVWGGCDHAATVGHDAAHMEGANVAPPAVNDAEAA